MTQDTVICPSCRKQIPPPSLQSRPEPLCPLCGEPLVEPELASEQPKPKERPRADRTCRPRSLQSSATAGTLRATSPTGVSLPASALIALTLSAAFYAGLHTTLKGGYLWGLFLTHGWVPPTIVFLGTWAAAILLLKTLAVLRQRAALRVDPLPLEPGETVKPNNVAEFLEHVRGLPSPARGSIFLRRVRCALEHFESRGNTADTQRMLQAQAGMDADSVDSSYTLLRVLIWAIPILGFIGTVVGIGEAVAGFSGSIENVEDMALIKESLTGVTTGLSTAFETTLVALVVSILVMFPARSLQKAEEDLLGAVNEYCNDDLLLRLESPEDAVSGKGSEVREAILALTAQQGAEFKRWSEQLESAGQSIAERIEKTWTSVQERLELGWTKHLGQIQSVLDGVARDRKEFSESVRSLHETQLKKLSESTEAAVEAARSVTTEITSARSARDEAAEKMLASFSTHLTRTTDRALERHLAGIETVQKSVSGLAETIADLGRRYNGTRDTLLTNAREGVKAVRDELQKLTGGLLERYSEQLQGMDRTAATLSGSLTQLGQQADSAQHAMLEQTRGGAAAVREEIQALARTVGKTLQGQVKVSRDLREQIVKGAEESVAGLHEETRLADKRMRQFLATLQALSRSIESTLGKKVERAAAELGRTTESSEKLTKIQYALASNLKVLATSKPLLGAVSRLTQSVGRLEETVSVLGPHLADTLESVDRAAVPTNGQSRWFRGRSVSGVTRR